MCSTAIRPATTMFAPSVAACDWSIRRLKREGPGPPTAPQSPAARTRSGAPCDRNPEPGRRRCRNHGGAPSTGAPRGNTNARRHGRYSAKTREIQALGRLQNRVADLARAQLAILKALACGDDHRFEIAEKRVAQCVQRLRQAALALDRVIALVAGGPSRFG